MSVSVFDLFSIGIGPSSSHTVGPMIAAKRFCVEAAELLFKSNMIKAELFGSLSLTGKGHGSDIAVLMGLSNQAPATINPKAVPDQMGKIISSGKIKLLDEHQVAFNTQDHLIFHQEEVLPKHANGMRFSLFDDQGAVLFSQEYYSIGGGFVVRDDEFDQNEFVIDHSRVKYPFKSAQELIDLCDEHQLTIAELMMANEQTWLDKEDIIKELNDVWTVMCGSIDNGIKTEGTLPGGLNIKRRAPVLFEKLKNSPLRDEMNWINLFAIAVNEENAAGGRVVTAPTNGAAGVIPAVMKYYDEFYGGLDQQKVADFLLTAGAIAILFREGASISAAEVGCQGEVGVACSMAAAALTALWGGSVAQIENAAEIGMEHHLGLTCDPIGGLVQIPCIERNTMGAVQAVNTAKLAMLGDGTHFVSLDAVIKTMLETGHDMANKYKETAQGGLAVNMPAC